MSDQLNEAINGVNLSIAAICRYITANDVGNTGGHQCGFHIPKGASSLLFDEPGKKGENLERTIRINWPYGIMTDSRAKYYGVGTRNEYRLTRFGKGFPFLESKYAGDLLVLAKISNDEYNAYILSRDEDIDGFLAYFDLSPQNLNGLINLSQHSPQERIAKYIDAILANTHSFPTTIAMSELARKLFLESHSNELKIGKCQDELLLGYIDSEFSLFRAFEDREVNLRGSLNFQDAQSLINFANSLTNRRKSRAGKSLEHHLAYIFTKEGIHFEEQTITEGNKRPDFIFPDSKCYHNLLFPADGLTFLGAKTTCKDRWRQVLNEADRIPKKFLFTLQQGISKNQLKEMKEENLTLVVPKPYIRTFDSEFQGDIYSLSKFIDIVRAKQEKYHIF